MWIKICGNTNLEDAQLAVEAGADALGFIFAPSPRRVTSGQAQKITVELPHPMEKYGVFVDAPLDEIVAAVETCGLTGVQLHRSRDRDLSSRLREHFARGARQLSIVSVLNVEAQADDGRDLPGSVFRNLDVALADASVDPAIKAVLVDSSTAAAVGGTGVSFDWAAAQASFLRAATQLRIILAGGLRPENVQHAILSLRPWGVDVVSGVEAAPGKKDPARLLAFVHAAREAEARLHEAE